MWKKPEQKAEEGILKHLKAIEVVIIVVIIGLLVFHVMT